MCSQQVPPGLSEEVPKSNQRASGKKQTEEQSIKDWNYDMENFISNEDPPAAHEIPEAEKQNAAAVAQTLMAQRSHEARGRNSIWKTLGEVYQVPQQMELVTKPPFGSLGGRFPDLSFSFNADPNMPHSGGPRAVDGKDLGYDPSKILVLRDVGEVVVPDAKKQKK
ncbi:unnamed protein product [Notodromas monacha]|uniref:Uncharacterized protein n=1 Tax=Notodromas monacha TaxID=399045 RepID=A0A7R9BK70_9CRUS|nr:unnamed protein product [Notodromas monacha]CAG0915494.1 unnamed protein product [Notodromas monacha]